MEQSSNKTPKSLHSSRPLDGVIAFADVRSKHSNHSEAVLDELLKLGAKVSHKLLPIITHVIFKDGSKNTEKKAKKYGAYLLNVDWLECCKAESSRACETRFIIGGVNGSSSKKKQKSMMPKDFSQEVRDASNRIERSKKRRSGIEIPAPLSNIAADRVNLNDYITCPRTPPAMQRRIDELKIKNSAVQTPLSPLVHSTSMYRKKQENVSIIDLGDSPELARPKSTLKYQRYINQDAADSYWRAAAGLENNSDLNHKLQEQLQVTPHNPVLTKKSTLPTSPPLTDCEDTSMPLCINSSMLDQPIIIPDLSPDKPIKLFDTNQLNVEPIAEPVTPKLNNTSNRSDKFNRPITPSDSTLDVSAFHHLSPNDSQVIPETPDSLGQSSTLQLLKSTTDHTYSNTNRESIQLISDSDRSAENSLTKPTVVHTKKKRSLGTRRRHSAIIIPNSEPHNNNTACNNKTDYSNAHTSETAITSNGTPSDFIHNHSVLLTSPIKLLELSSSGSDGVSQETVRNSVTKREQVTEADLLKKSAPKRKSSEALEKDHSLPLRLQTHTDQLSSMNTVENNSDKIIQPLEPVRSRKLYQWNISSPLELRNSSCEESILESPIEMNQQHPSLTVLSQVASKISETNKNMTGRGGNAAKKQPLKPAKQYSKNSACSTTRDLQSHQQSNDNKETQAVISETGNVWKIHTTEVNIEKQRSAINSHSGTIMKSCDPERAMPYVIRTDRQDTSIEKQISSGKQKSSIAVKVTEQMKILEDGTSKTMSLIPVTGGQRSQSQANTGKVIELRSAQLRDINQPQKPDVQLMKKDTGSDSISKRKISVHGSSPPIIKQKRTRRRKTKQTQDQRDGNDPPSNTVSPDRPNTDSENIQTNKDSKRQRKRKKDRSALTDVNNCKEPALLQANSESVPLIRARAAASLSSVCSSAASNSSFNKKSMVLTSLHSADRSFVRSVVKELGDYKIKPEVDKSTHVVICGDNRRTLNVLRAISHRTVLLNLDWVTDSYESGNWLDMMDDKYQMTSTFPGSKLAFSNNNNSPRCGGLFVSVGNIYISPLTNPPQNDLHELIKLNAGQATTNLRNGTIQVGRSFNDSNKLPIVKESWVLDSITHQRLLDHNFYTLTPINMNSSTDSHVFN